VAPKLWDFCICYWIVAVLSLTRPCHKWRPEAREHGRMLTSQLNDREIHVRQFVDELTL
jgi:hypothetical protein